MSSILVTGASGFLGTRLVLALRREGKTVVTHSVEDGDLRFAPPAAKDVAHVYHLAAKTYVPDSWANPADFYGVNVLGTVNVLDYCRRTGASLTLISSYVYGTPQYLPISEDHPLSAPNPYAHTKLLTEEVGRFYHNAFQVPVTIVRPFNMYGPGQPDHFLIPTLIRQAISPACAEISVADHRPKRDYVYVDDVVDLLLVCCRASISGTFNAGSGTSISVQDLARTIVDLVHGEKPVVSRNEVRPNEIMDTVADISRAREQLGWQPKTGLRTGLEQTIASML